MVQRILYDSRMIVDGKAVAQSLYDALQKERAAFGDVTLGHLVTEMSPVTMSYARIKERGAERLGIKMIRTELPEGSDTSAAVAAIRALSEKCDGVIPQLPIVPGIDAVAVINAVPKEQDVDVLSDAAVLEFEKGEWPAVPPVPAALKYILEYHKVPIKGANVVIIGQGRLVGKPASVLFKRAGADVHCLIKGDDVTAATREADIILSGAGVPGLIRPDMVKDGVAIVDAGTSESGGKVVGDADPACAEKASLFTPVPGGVGPVAIAHIYVNLFALKKKYE